MDARPQKPAPLFSALHPFGSSILLVAAFATVTPTIASARGMPQIQFDVNPLVECSDVTDEEFALTNPDERLVEAKFAVSAFLARGNPDALVGFLYRVESPLTGLQVIDYFPKTTLESDLASNISVEEKRETTTSLGLNLSGQHEPVRGSANASTGAKNGKIVRFERRPAMELLSASGTIRRGRGAYFKLRPSPRGTLEGSREFAIVLRVPSDWRNAYLHLHCQAESSRNPLLPYGQPLDAGHQTFVLALYQAGDEVAKSTARDLIRQEFQLRHLAKSAADSIRKRAYRSAAHQLAGWLDVAKPRIPEEWMDRVLYGPPDPSQIDFLDRLPGRVADASRRYLLAKGKLNGTATAHSLTRK